MPAHTIDEVIAQLDEIIARSRRENSRLGFFAALYRQVTIKVKDGIASGRFEDGVRMERLDVIFADRYLEALGHFRAGEPANKCWHAAFEAATSWRLLILLGHQRAHQSRSRCRRSSLSGREVAGAEMRF